MPVWVKRPIPAGEDENTTPPLAVSFNTVAVTLIVLFWPMNVVPFGVNTTEWKLSGVNAQLESCSIASARIASKQKCRAQFFIAPPEKN
jgi:hypothetical protein